MTPVMFYLRHSGDSEVEGPFTIEQINEMVREKRFTFKSLAVIDAGQGLQGVQNVPIKQWIMLADIPGFKPNPDEERNCLSIALVMLIVFVILAVFGLIKLIDILGRM